MILLVGTNKVGCIIDKNSNQGTQLFTAPLEANIFEPVALYSENPQFGLLSSSILGCHISGPRPEFPGLGDDLRVSGLTQISPGQGDLQIFSLIVPSYFSKKVIKLNLLYKKL
ncbi:hypothetical protein NQ318_022002 [Aromia moschata]|uniref:Uncharacterized protein n=1 Tax=Aromia moschata TaxID=1265417 RepID=A0AAV8Z6B6_9CUCU|nr:hypothetical protein NQ318_022002 [Aromia moschata]